MKILDILQKGLSDTSIKYLLELHATQPRSVALYDAAPEQIRQAFDAAKAWTAQEMPLTVSHLQKSGRVHCLAMLLAVAAKAIDEGEIQKARYESWKSLMSSIVEKSTSGLAGQLDAQYFHIWVSYRDSHRTTARMLLGYASTDSIHELKSMHKHLLKYKNKQDQLCEYEQLCYEPRLALFSELQLIHEINAYLKTIIVKTQREAATPKLNQGDQMLCGYCFRPTRYMPKSQTVIAYHGFTREYGYGEIISSSCNGSQQQPLESSPVATLQLLADLNKMRVRTQAELESLEQQALKHPSDPKEIALLPLEQRKQVVVLQQKLRDCRYDLSRYIPQTGELALAMLQKYHPDHLEQAKQIFMNVAA